MSDDNLPQLFHSIAQAASGNVRRFVVDHDLTERVRFRNVTYPEVLADLESHGGTDTPALWDGERLVVGEDAVIAALSTL